jgi:copper chaperone NosL
MKLLFLEAFLVLGGILIVAGCSRQEVKPVEIYPEDECSNCRMEISTHRFASEIITQEDEALKFDDLECLERYRQRNPLLKAKAIFVMDYETSQWMPYEQSVIVKTCLSTPMGSGKIAVRDSARAEALAKEYPLTSAVHR